MTIIHGMNESLVGRPVAASLQDRLRVIPAVAVTGPRRPGTSTLAQELALEPRRFDNPTTVALLSAPPSDIPAKAGIHLHHRSTPTIRVSDLSPPPTLATNH